MLPDLRTASAAEVLAGREERAGAPFLLMGMMMSSGVLNRVRAAERPPKQAARAARTRAILTGAVFLNGFLVNGCADDPARTTDSGANGKNSREVS
jgi:hypothetical protein